jgi:2-polyprenyl-3-methyl-5-hydroxy-6-metoxy-1,4-benzoquinol methylase
MALTIDPQGTEIRALRRVTNWRGKEVLEIGCGKGRLTLRLAGLGAKMIHAFDPDSRSIAEAKRNLPKRLASRIDYRVGHAEHVNHPAERFDVVIFAWAL